MRDPKDDFEVLVINIPVRDTDLVRAFNAMTHQSKNLYNTGLFLIRQVQTAYEFVSETKANRLKAELHPIQIQVIAHFNAVIERINAARMAKLPARQAKAEADGKEYPKLKIITALGAEVENLTGILLDATVLDNVTRDWKDENGASVYARLPGAMAQQTLGTLKDGFSGYFGALRQWNASKAGMTGRPRLPDYLHKNGRFVLEIPLVQVHGSLPSLKGKMIHDDYAETSLLPPDVLSLVGEFDVKKAIEKACKTRGWTTFRPQHLRIVPLHKGVKLEAVVRVHRPYPEQSFLSKMVKAHGPALAVQKTAKKRDEWMADFLKDLPFDALPRIAAMDMGLNNLVSMALSTGHKATVVDGSRYDAAMGVFNAKIDAIKSKLTPERVKELQKKQDTLKKKDERLSKSESIELKMLLKELYAHPDYRCLIDEQSRWKSDFLHKLSRGLIRQCVAKGIDVIVIGRNKGWKQETDMGRTQNRRFCQTAHAKLIEMIRYKAESHGIAVVQTEERAMCNMRLETGDSLVQTT